TDLHTWTFRPETPRTYCSTEKSMLEGGELPRTSWSTITARGSSKHSSAGALVHRIVASEVGAVHPPREHGFRSEGQRRGRSASPRRGVGGRETSKPGCRTHLHAPRVTTCDLAGATLLSSVRRSADAGAGQVGDLRLGTSILRAKGHTGCSGGIS